jgi:predicted hydrocarbon binding protein
MTDAPFTCKPFEDRMIASTHDLPLHGNYFADDGYFTHNPNAGTIHNRAGARMIALTDDFLIATHNSLEAELGDRAAIVLAAAARDWGRRAAEQFAAEMEQHHGRPLSNLPLSLFAADLTEAFRHHGWGVLNLDFAQHPYGLLVIDVRMPIVGRIVKKTSSPADVLLAGFLAGMFSQFAGTSLGCLETESVTPGSLRSRFVLALPDRLDAVRSLAERRKGHAEIVAQLLKTRAAK